MVDYLACLGEVDMNNVPITDAELAEVKRLKAAATDGKWASLPRGGGRLSPIVIDARGLTIAHLDWNRDGLSIAALHNAFDGLVARLEAAEAAMQWRPISEAPKDGTIILVHRFGCATPFLAAWLDGAAIAQPGWHHVDINKRFHTDPTHYLPLPAPPEATR